MMRDMKKLLALQSNYHCKHGHDGLSHPQCWQDYVAGTGNEFVIGYFDIEATNLKADFGVMISYAFKEKGKNKIYSNVLQQEDINSLRLDKPLVGQLLEDLKRFGMVVTYYGTKYDIPFTRTRALKWGLHFPDYGEIIHHDLYYTVKSKLCLSRNRLENVGNLFGLEGLKTHLDPDIWTQALLNEKARNYILDHNKRDVILLEKCHDRMTRFVKGIRRSV